MERTQDENARRVAELLKAFAYLALAVFFADGIIDFVNAMRFDRTFGGFLSACWGFLEDLFRMGVFYVALLAASHALSILIDLKASANKERQV